MLNHRDLERLDHIETPYYIIDENELRSNVEKLRMALNTSWNNSLIAYSFKANALPWLLTYFMNSGLYAEVVSDDELQLALMLGYEKSKIVYNGPCKTRVTFLDAINNGCLVNIDSQRELLWLNDLDRSENKKYNVGIRVNFDLEVRCPGESVAGAEGSRFGFCYENGELKKAIDYIRHLDNVSLVGLHLHCSSKSRSVNIFRTISRIACEITESYALDLAYVDIGGGFYGGLIDKPQFTDYFEAISGELSKTFDKDNTVLIVEPGTSLVSSPFSYVTKVTDIKQTTANIFVVTDGSRVHVDPLMKKTGYFFDLINNQDSKGTVLEEQVITGFTCMEFDRLFVLEKYPKLSVGDRIIYQKVGAYTLCLSPLFIKNFPAVYVKNDDNCILVRKPGTVKEYLNINDLVIP
jgi:diaminopimelate decarboxylase